MNSLQKALLQAWAMAISGLAAALAFDLTKTLTVVVGLWFGLWIIAATETFPIPRGGDGRYWRCALMAAAYTLGATVVDGGLWR